MRKYVRAYFAMFICPATCKGNTLNHRSIIILSTQSTGINFYVLTKWEFLLIGQKVGYHFCANKMGIPVDWSKSRLSFLNQFDKVLEKSLAVKMQYF